MHYPRLLTFRTGLTGFLILLLVACSPGNRSLPVPNSQADAAVGTGSDTAIHQSRSDHRKYRHLTLANGLQVLLISDPEADKSAASLSVNFGSFQNPEDRQGLAHFLEHMLFLGTEKYPEPGAYQAFISEHGGHHNAYTSMEETNYFFDVDSEFLVPVLDRFSQFFVAPLFNQDYVDREQHAVESEYRLRIKDDNYREWDVLRELVNEAHPLHGFSVGNLDTLADREADPVREDLLDFYQRYYSANQMKLVVLGREDLNELEQAVGDRFTPITNHHLAVKSAEIPLFSRELPLRVYIRPIQEKHELSFLFPVPGASEHWQTKPLQYLGHLLGHEGPDSLLMSLKSRGLAEGLAAGRVYDSRVGAAFAITISLTPKGVAQSADIEKDTFAWLRLVRQRGIEAWRYREIANLGRIAFEFQEKTAPASYVRRISAAMHELPPAEVLRSPTTYYRFDASLIEHYASFLNPGNVLVTLIDPGVETDRQTQLYHAPYKTEVIAEAEQRAWRQTSDVALRLPAPNPYIPDQLTVSDAAGDLMPHPVLSQGGNSLWLYRDSVFRTPKATFDVRIATPATDTIDGQALTDLYLALVRDQLVPEVYPARLAGLGFNLGQWENGVAFSIDGYSQKQPLLLRKVLQAMAHPDWDDRRFKRVKAGLLRDWRNSVSDGPMSQVFSQFRPLLRGVSHPLQRALALENVSLEQLREFAGGLYQRGHGRFYAGGNLEIETARSMTQATLETLAVGQAGDAAVEYQVRKLPAVVGGLHFDLPVDHPDAAIAFYVQGREDSLRERARMALLQKVTEAPFYTSLRTEKQLGYQVGNTIAHFNRVPGLVFYLQSPVTDAGTLQAEISGFVDDFADRVMSLADEELARVKASVLAGIEQTPQNLRELAGRHLESLDLDYPDFDFRALLAEEVEAIGVEELRNSYRDLLQGDISALWIMTRPVSEKDPASLARLQVKDLSEAEKNGLGGRGGEESGARNRVFRYPQ